MSSNKRALIFWIFSPVIIAGMLVYVFCGVVVSAVMTIWEYAAEKRKEGGR